MHFRSPNHQWTPHEDITSFKRNTINTTMNARNAESTQWKHHKDHDQNRPAQTLFLLTVSVLLLLLHRRHHRQYQSQLYKHIHTRTHTTVLLLFWNMSGTTQVSRYQKGKTRKVKTNLDSLEQEIVSGSGICWAIQHIHKLITKCTWNLYKWAGKYTLAMSDTCCPSSVWCKMHDATDAETDIRLMHHSTTTYRSSLH